MIWDLNTGFRGWGLLDVGKAGEIIGKRRWRGKR
jgi:hypothetical protein